MPSRQEWLIQALKSWVCCNKYRWQALIKSKANLKIQIGEKNNKSLWAGASPDMGRPISRKKVKQTAEAVKGADMVFVTSGMGGRQGRNSPVLPSIPQRNENPNNSSSYKTIYIEGKKD